MMLHMCVCFTILEDTRKFSAASDDTTKQNEVFNLLSSQQFLDMFRFDAGNWNSTNSKLENIPFIDLNQFAEKISNSKNTYFLSTSNGCTLCSAPCATEKTLQSAVFGDFSDALDCSGSGVFSADFLPPRSRNSNNEYICTKSAKIDGGVELKIDSVRFLIINIIY